MQQELCVHYYLGAIEDLRGLLVEDDGLAVDVAGQAAGHGRQEDEDDVGGHRGRVLTPGARPSVTPLAPVARVSVTFPLTPSARAVRANERGR